ncbi:MAG TPA: efflux transporter outer membrane subunit [Burkholderiales bacterium]|nr:efflux transporter outer membrane subunit [Burkholderiales bacterium]
MHKRYLTALAAATLLSACTVGPDYKRPSFDLPSLWGKKEDATPVAAKPPEKWWGVYGDTTLDTLVAEALEHNRDLAAAAARIEQARASLTITNADRYPVISANGNTNRTRASTVGSFPIPANFVETNDTRLTLNASYETDFWGKYRRASEAARATLLASEAGRDAVLLGLTSDVVKSYYNLLSLRGQEQAAQRTLATREQFVDLQSKRFSAGVASELDVRQTEADRDSAKVQLISLGNQREAEDARMAVLLGRSPREVWEKRMDQVSAELTGNGPLAVPAGLPSDLLERRPDLKQAEQQLIAANARIGAAKANYFPDISLTGYLGTESTALANLFTGPARIFQYAAGLTAPLWNAGRLGAQVDYANAQQKEALANYEKSVQSAFADVRTALSAYSAARQTAETQTQRTQSLDKAYKLARMRYDNGVSSLLDVLDAERNLLAAELSRIDALAAQRSAVADLIKALGGGWPAA